MKTCKACGQDKPISEFAVLYKNRRLTESRRNICEKCRNRRSSALRRDRGDSRAMREMIIKEYGGKCACCGDSHDEFLSIDHIGNWGHTEGKRNKKRGGVKLYKRLRAAGFPKDRYRLLCHNCNMSIGFYGYCPHKPLIVCAPAWEMALAARIAESSLPPLPALVRGRI